MNKYLSIGLFAAFSFSALAQKGEALDVRIDSIKVLAKRILSEKTDSARITANENFLMLMQQTLNNPASFEASFDSVKNVSVLTSPDHTLRIYTWTLPRVDMSSYRFFGFAQYLDSKKKLKVVRLEDTSASEENPESLKLSPESWFGSVYYDMIETKKGSKKYYTLLGWKGNNSITTKKLMDVVYFKKDSLAFGYPLFKSEKGYVNRVVFEYASEAVMSLRYHHSKKTIVFDHLSAISGNTAGPDGTYDAYREVKGRWEFMKDIDVSKFSER